MKGIEFFFPRRYNTPHNGVYCLRRIKQGKNVLFFYLYQDSSKQTVWFIQSYQSSTKILCSAEPKKESNSINLDFYKCLNFLLSMSCSIHFLKNPIPQIL